MIVATVQPTPPLGTGRTLTPAARTQPTPLRSATTPTSPVILLRGCGRITLSLSNNQAAQWSVKAYPLSVSSAPAVAPAAGAVATLSSDAIGFFSVHATVLGQTYDWFVRFIDLAFARPGGSDLEVDSAPALGFHFFIGHVCLSASFDCKMSIALRGSDEQPSCYDDVTCGILQNMIWSPGQTLHGIYCARGTNNVKGHLFEPLPRAPSPNVDSGDEEKFPFYDAKESPQTGSLRRLTFDDAPGIVIPLLYNPAVGRVDDFENKWAEDKDYLVLRKIAGAVSFRSAVAAKCKNAPYSYVVRGWVQWDLIYNQRIEEIPAQDFPPNLISLDINNYLGAGTAPNGTVLGNPAVQINAAPADAAVAGIESFGPPATKTDKTYRWQPQGGVLT